MKIAQSAWLLASAVPSPLLAAADKGAQPSLDPMNAGSVAQVVLSLLLVVALILALAWLLRRFGGWSQGSAGVVRIVGGQSLGQRERIVLVQVGDEQVLLGVAPGRVQTLHVLQRPVSVETAPSPGGGTFAQRFGEALKKGGRQ